MYPADLIASSLWQLFAAILVLFMQAGFLLLEAGRVRERNSVSVAQKNVADLVVCWVVFLTFGYWLAFGIESPLVTDSVNFSDVTRFVYQLGFCGAAATIISGAVAERFRFESYLVLTCAVAAMFYPLSVYLIWGNSFVAERSAPLAELGFVDFAGGTAVHVLSGAIALAAAVIVGPRVGRFSDTGEVNEIHGYSPVLQLSGTLVLILGWLGFNAGSLSISDPKLAQALLNTLTAACFGALAGMLIGYVLDHGVFNPNRTINGIIAGLVSITAGAPYASASQAAGLAVFAACIAVYAADYITCRLKIDDPLDVFATHGVAGVIGTVAVVGFLTSDLLVSGSRLEQLWVQMGGSLLIALLGFFGGYAFLWLVNKIYPARVSDQNQKFGLNYTQHGVHLDAEELRQTIGTKVSDAGRFDGSLQTFVDMPNEGAELAVALRDLIKKHEIANDTIHRQSERFKQFASTTNDLLWETDARCVFTTVNANNEIATTNDTNALLGANLFDCFEASELDRVDALQRIVDRKPLARTDVRCTLTHSKRVLRLRISGVPYFDDDGVFLGYRGGASDVTEQKLAESRALFLANHDQLTGLMNRRALETELQRTQGGGRFAIGMIDLDGFKPVNDEYGHQTGDELLCHVANAIIEEKREADLVFRIGGDEFVVLLRDLRDAYLREDAAVWGDRLIGKLSKPIEIAGNKIYIGASVGVSVFPDDGRNLTDLIRLADLALYQAKNQGKGCVVAFDQAMDDLTQKQRQLRTELDLAFKREEFFLAYQPKLCLATGNVAGFEALARWRHPIHGVLNPDRFLFGIEKNGRMIEFGKWALKSACQTAVSWPDSSAHVAVNISPSQLADANFVDSVGTILSETGLASNRLELELVEESLLTGFEETKLILKDLQSLGVSIAIDDFGCGSTSLQYLYRLPVNKLKIDKSFVQSLSHDDRAHEIAHSIVKLARELDMKVTAEGVEDRLQYDILSQWSCDEIQGYLISNPILNTDDVVRWMTEPMHRES